MTTKIKDGLEQEIIRLAKEGHNCRSTAIKVGLNPETVRQWAFRKKIIFQTGQLEIRKKEPGFIDLLRKGCLITQACKESGIDTRLGKEWAIKNGMGDAIRSRTEAALDKNISLSDANKRLPKDHGKVISYDQIIGAYVIQRMDGTTYNRITSQIFRGDPNLSKKRRCTEEEIESALLKINYRLIKKTYTVKHNPVQAEHIVCGYIRENVFQMFFKQSCPRCANIGSSKEEVEVHKWIESLGIISRKFKFEREYSGKGKAKEIDIYVPEIKLGIEYCGLYHHGEKQILNSLEKKIERNKKKGKDYKKTDYDSPRFKHRAKLIKSNDIGIRLITVFSNEWKNDQEKVKSILKAKLGKNEIKIFARKTEIKEIDKNQSKTFLDNYHLQGGSQSLIAFGLFYENELVAVITGGHHHRLKGKFVLNRLCFKSNVTVIGGSSKLNKALENWARSNGYKEIISWSDNRWSDGAVYMKLGYRLEEEMKPDYFYFDNRGKVYSKQSSQKKFLLKKGAIGNTEWEMAQSLKFDRIWDCGKKRWIKKL